MKIITLCVGEVYCKKYAPIIRSNIPNPNNLTVITDLPQYFTFCNTIRYESESFSYFDKIIYLTKICNDLRKDVVYLDADSFSFTHPRVFSNEYVSSYFLYHKLWIPNQFTKVEALPKELVQFYDITENYKIENIEECFFYLPYNSNSEKLMNDIKFIKPIWEKFILDSGIKNKYSKTGIGYGEGIPFSLALKQNNFKLHKYDFKLTTIL